MYYSGKVSKVLGSLIAFPSKPNPLDLSMFLQTFKQEAKILA